MACKGWCSCSSSCCGWFALYMCWCWFCELFAVWSRLTEQPWECDGPPLPANHSGVRVLVAGFAKTGTRTASKTLFKVGVENAYHSEDFGLFLWQRHVDKYFLARNGNSWARLPMNPNVFNMGVIDYEVLNHTSPEELAALFARCRVGAMSFDATERLFFPLYQVTPGAKVIMLNWRTYNEWLVSFENFIPQVLLEHFVLTTLVSGASALPWHALFLPLMERISKNRISRALKHGGPPLLQSYDPSYGLLHAMYGCRRVMSRWFSGLGMKPENQEEYLEFYRKVKELVPPENLLEWDLRTARYDDLCDFLGIDPCPVSGKLVKATNNFAFTLDYLKTTAVGTTFWIVIHRWNWLILRLFRGLLRRWRENKPRAKVE